MPNKYNISVKFEFDFQADQPYNRREPSHDVFTDRLKATLLIRINSILKTVPGHPHIHLVFPTLENWSTEYGLLNAQGKVNKIGVEAYFSEDIGMIE